MDIKKGKLVSHRSTTYPCYLPVLGDSAGAGRIRLTHCKNTFFFDTANKFGKIFFKNIYLSLNEVFSSKNSTLAYGA